MITSPIQGINDYLADYWLQATRHDKNRMSWFAAWASTAPLGSGKVFGEIQAPRDRARKLFRQVLINGVSLTRPAGVKRILHLSLPLLIFFSAIEHTRALAQERSSA